MKIMVTMAGSRFAEAVVEPAAQLAREAKAEVYLVQVLDPSDVHST
jgi:nucleotide-binding universal stress UspA family protein